MELIIGLLIQGSALALLFSRLRRSWFTHMGAIFIIAATLYHGLGEILVRLFPGYDLYRSTVSTHYVNEFLLWISIAILLVTLAYLFALGRPQPAGSKILTAGIRRTAWFFDWRIMLLAAMPLVYLIVRGIGSSGNGIAQTGTAVTAGLALNFYILALVLASVGVIMRFGLKWTVPVFFIQSAVLGLVGQRAVIVFSGIMLLYVLARLGMHVPRRSFLIGIVVMLAAGLVITSARAQEGRFTSAAGTSVRISRLLTGITHIASAATRHQLATDLGYRLDGNSFGALELAAFANGESNLGITPLKNDVLIAVPSFINPNKDKTDIGAREEQIYAEEHLGLVQFEVGEGVWLNSLPTQLGITVGYWGPWAMLLIAIFIGLVFGRLDRWLLAGLDPGRVIVGLGLVACVLDYEGSWSTYTITFRGVILLALAAWVAHRMRRIGRHLSTSPGSSPTWGSSPREQRSIPASATTGPRRDGAESDFPPLSADTVLLTRLDPGELWANVEGSPTLDVGGTR